MNGKDNKERLLKLLMGELLLKILVDFIRTELTHPSYNIKSNKNSY